jgi:hypothetical protein
MNPFRENPLSARQRTVVIIEWLVVATAITVGAIILAG